MWSPGTGLGLDWDWTWSGHGLPDYSWLSVMSSSSGMSKMKCNAIMFENPTPKIYSCLPPPIEDLDEVLAFIFTGPAGPSPENYESLIY